MARVLAVAGKGGTGKTTFNALLVKYLLEKEKGTILAVDADANANLNEALGLERELTIADVLSDVKDGAAIPKGMSKEAYVQFRLSQAVIETPKLDLLVMGRPQGPGCYCYANTLLKGYLENLGRSYDFLIVDNEAGMEHISRRTIERPDDLFLTSDASMRGIRSARRIYDLIQEMKIPVGRVHLVVTMTRSEDWVKVLQEFKGVDINFLGDIPYDPIVAAYDEEGKPLLHLPQEAGSVAAVNKMLDSILG